MRTLPRWFQLLALLTAALVLSACGGGGSSDKTATFTIEGWVLNGALVGSTVEVFSANGRNALGTATTDGDGRYTAEVSQEGPYRLRASGGKLGGVDYVGILESFCPAGSGCFVTPYTSILLRLVDDHGFNYGDATALMAASLGFDGDPFAEEVPAEDFDLGAAREAIAGGTGLEAWVGSIVGWATGEDVEPPPGIAEPKPGDPPVSPVDPDPAPVPDPDPDPDPVPDPDPGPGVPVTHTVSATAGDGGGISPTSQEVDHGTTAEFTVTPETGYSIDIVSGCDGSLDGNTYTTAAITGACTVEVTFIPNTYTITFVPSGGETPAPETMAVIFGEAYGTLATTERSSHEFLGWFTKPVSGTQITEATKVTQATDHSLYAQWKIVPPQNLRLSGRDGQIVVTWDPVTGAEGYNLCYARESGIDPTYCQVYQGGHLVLGATSPYIADGLINGIVYWFVVTAESQGTESRPTDERFSSPNIINDTGITFCGDADGTNNAHCIGNEPERQDAAYGRDAASLADTLAKFGGGFAGFDFTKISNTGDKLPESAPLGPGPTQWACTLDNLTGLMWEAKVADPNDLRYYGHTYTWYDPQNPNGPGSENGGICNGSRCDTTGFVEAVNQQGLCGKSEWRMPTRTELAGIVNYGQYPNAIDLGYFPNNDSVLWWTGSPHANAGSEDSWALFFLGGAMGPVNRSLEMRVRLVTGLH